MTAKLKIRNARAEDLQTVVDFNCRLAQETEHKTLEPPVIEAGVKRAIATPALCRYFVVEIDGEIIGQTMITFEWSDWRNGLFWWIQSVYVKKEHRRQGVFRALYQHVEKAAKDEGGACGIRLYVETENQAAISVYRALDMVPSGHLLFEADWSKARRETS